MSQIVSTSLPPPHPAARDVAAGQHGAQRTETSGTLSAQAVRAVEAARNAAKVRLHSRHEDPVGPPPAFEVNVLDDIRERLAMPEALSPKPSGWGTKPESASNSAEQTAPAREAALHSLDKKV